MLTSGASIFGAPSLRHLQGVLSLESAEHLLSIIRPLLRVPIMRHHKMRNTKSMVTFEILGQSILRSFNKRADCFLFSWQLKASSVQKKGKIFPNLVKAVRLTALITKVSYLPQNSQKQWKFPYTAVPMCLNCELMNWEEHLYR